MSKVTKNVSNYIQRMGINVKDLSRSTGIPYSNLYTSLKASYRERDLRDDELLTICQHLEVDPMRFMEE